VLPYAGTIALAFVLVGIERIDKPMQYAAAAALALIAVALGVVASSEALVGVRGLLGWLVFLAALFLLRDSLGGNGAGVGVLSLLPICWLALYGTRSELLAGLGALAAFWVLPVALISGTGYPPSQLRAATLYVAVAALIGLTVQGLIRMLAGQARDVARVATAARSILLAQDARSEICAAAREVAGASFVVLVERADSGRLRPTAMSGIDPDIVTIQCAVQLWAPDLAFGTQRRVWAHDGAVTAGMWQLPGQPASMLFEPVLHGERCAGVLVVGWAQRVSDISGGPALIGLLAAEAATAIAHGDLIEQLAQQASTDALTGLPNRRAWTRHLDCAIADAGRELCVAMLDLDDFKAFNDEHGHLAGDRQLTRTAAAWRVALRPNDVLARLGGDEFAVLLCDCTPTGAASVIERLRAATPAQQTCSAGLVTHRQHEPADALMARADSALYDSKHAGRNQLTATHTTRDGR
jgi:diguanylate cyclase (GGDEF)-like protein